LQRNTLKSSKALQWLWQKAEVKNQTIPCEKLRGYIVIVYEDHWWPGYVLQKYEENEKIKIRFLHPHGPSPSFVYLSQLDELILLMSLILSMVTPTFEILNFYHL
jgi:hypothetical protein